MTSNVTTSSSGFQFTVPVNVLDDLCCRFIINVPAQEKKDLVRICFQIEQAHWFYLDFYSNSATYNLKSCGIKEFARNVFHHIPYLKPFVRDLDEIIEDWKEYKYAVPTFGAMLLDEELKYVLLVKSYWSKSSWGFPKGKINKDETPCNCAVREVFEETGFDISSYMDENAFVEAIVNDQCVRLYIIQGISRKIEFQPQTRNEIKEINWFLIDDIPLAKSKFKNKNYSSFFMVVPFMRELRKWLLQKSVRGTTKNRRSIKSFSEVEHLLHFDSPIQEELTMENSEYKIDASFGKKKKKKENELLPSQVKVIQDDHYEGSEEDETVKSNEEVYGIPKVKPLGFHSKETISLASLREIVDNFSFVRERKYKISFEGFNSLSYSYSPYLCLPNKDKPKNSTLGQNNFFCDNNLVYNKNENTKHCLKMRNDDPVSSLSRNVEKTLNLLTSDMVKSLETKLSLNAAVWNNAGAESKELHSMMVHKLVPDQIGSLEIKSKELKKLDKRADKCALEESYLKKFTTCPQLSSWRNFKFDMKQLNRYVAN